MVKHGKNHRKALQAVSGLDLLSNKDAIIKVADLITTNDFYKNNHQLIYETMKELYEKREPIDLLSLISRLEEKGQLETVGGRTYLTTLANSVPTSSHVVYYAKNVQNTSRIKLSETTLHNVGFTLQLICQLDVILSYNKNTNPL